MNVDRALNDLANIRAQLDRTESLQGFRSVAAGCSVALVAVGYMVQLALIENAAQQVKTYLVIWISVAVASAAIAGVEMIVRGFQSGKASVWKLHQQLSLRMLPSLFVGFILTVLVAVHCMNSPEQGMLWVLPGLWSMIYSLGLFSCLNCLPRYSVWVAAYFLIVGTFVVVANLYWWQTSDPLQMLVTFGIGQSGLVTVLQLNIDLEEEV